MPNRYESLVVKLISIGLSHDLTHLEQIKYTKEGDAMKWTEGDFIATYRKMFQALTTLGFIIKDYSLRRLCIQAASVCEPSSKFCSEILAKLPEAESVECELNPEMKMVLLHLREQLESFKSAIQMNVSLPATWDTASIQCYEKLEYLNRRVQLSEDLKPLEYPGVERYLKKLQKEPFEEDEAAEKKTLDATQILKDSTEFAKMVSSHLKRFKNPFNVYNNVEPPSPSEVNAVMINVLRNCPDFEISDCGPDFEISDCGQVFMNVSKDFSLDSMKLYVSQYDQINHEQLQLNKPNLLFDFDMTERESSDGNVAEMYQEGTVRVYNLCSQGYSLFEVENVMLYAIMEKKMKFIQSEFADFNKNRLSQDTENQVHHAFNYLTCRPQPEYYRLRRVIYVACSAGMLEYNLVNFTFETIPGKYKYLKKKSQDMSFKEDIEASGEEKQLDQVMEIPKEPPTSASTATCKKSSRKSPKVPKITPPKEPRKELISNSERTVSQSKDPKGKKELITLESDASFHASDELLDIFLLLQNELSIIAKEKVTINLKQMSDESSPHKVELFAKLSDGIKGTEVKVQKRRNQRCGPAVIQQITLPAHTHGAIIINLEIVDEIVYDENNDNPRIKSTHQVKLNGGFTLDRTSHNIKNMNLNCSVNGIESRIKVSFRNEYKTKKKKPVEMDAQMATGKKGNGSETNDSKPIEESTNVDASFSSPTDNRSSDEANAILLKQFKQVHHTSEQVNSSVKHLYYENYSTTNLPSPPFDMKNISPFAQSNFNQHERSDVTLTALVCSPASNYSEVIKCAQQFQMNNVKEAFLAYFPPVIKTEPSLPEFENNNSFAQVSEAIHANAVTPGHDKVQILNTDDLLPSNNDNNLDPIAASLVMSSGHQFNVPESSMQGETDQEEPQDVTEFIEENYVSDASRNDIVKSPVMEDFLDFDEVLPATQVVRLYPVNNFHTRPQEQTPPTSPPPLHYHTIITDARKPADAHQAKRFKENFDAPADRILNFTPPDEVNEVIDLTEDADMHLKKRVKPRIGPRSQMLQKPCPAGRKVAIDPIFISCDSTSSNDEFRLDMLTTEVEPEPNDLKKNYSRVMKKLETKNMFVAQSNGAKRFRLSVDDSDSTSFRHTEVRLVNVLKHVDMSALKKDIYVDASLVRMKMPENVSFVDLLFRFCHKQTPVISSGKLIIQTAVTTILRSAISNIPLTSL